MGSARFRRAKRSGISNLIGAIFFVLIVVLVISTLTIIFDSSSWFIGGIHTSNAASLQQVNSKLSVAALTFGGEQGTATVTTPAVASLTSTPQLPLLPVGNMNFTAGLKGWEVNESYPALVDSGTVSNSLPSNGSSYVESETLTSPQQSDPVTFALTVTNSLTSVNDIASVSILIDTYFNCTGCAAASVTPAPGWTAAPVSGMNITWTTPVVNVLVPGDTITFQWSADVPPNGGIYYHTVVLEWVSPSTGDYADSGIATVQTIVTSPLPNPNPPAPQVAVSGPVPGENPGGLATGYDSAAVPATASNGPGAVYVDFEPLYGGQQLAAGLQMEGITTLSASFSLSLVELTDIGTTVNASVSSSLDLSNTTSNPLVDFHLILVNPHGVSVVINQGGTDPTTVNHFAPTGWQTSNFTASPASAFWIRGTYTFELQVNMTVPGGNPAQVSMHFDNLGLSIALSASQTSAYASQVLPMELGLPGVTTSASTTILTDTNANWLTGQWVGDTLTYTSGAAAGESMVITANSPQTLTTAAFPSTPTSTGGDNFVIRAKGNIQSLSLLVTVGTTSANPSGPVPDLVNTTAYVYIADRSVPLLNEPATVTWVQLGTLDFNGTAQLQVSIPLPQVAYYVNSSGSVELKVVAISPGSGASCVLPLTCAISTSASLTAGTTDTGQMAFTISGMQGTAPTEVTSLYVSGPNGTLPIASGPTNGVERFQLADWVSTGSSIVVTEALDAPTSPPTVFSWIPGEVYQVTLVTSAGISYSASFTAP